MHPKPDKKRPTSRTKAYREARDTYLGEHPTCEVCGAATASTIHHRAGRLGRLLMEPRNMLAVCDPCHVHIHANPEWARAEGYMVSRHSEVT